MRLFGLLPFYFAWHYTKALKNIVAITKNLAWFFWHFFSVGLLTMTLFSPWQRIQEERPKNSIAIGPILSTILINVLMRITGAVIRSVMIAVGLATIIVVITGGAVFFVLWLLFPVLIIGTLLLGIGILVKSL